ncbi:MAG: AarF/UbiB family protein, partial [Gammaproteobacteria bacterium]|nr:AarF/UbiB family protein [Gammaproteobacteria bacterium]
MLWETLSAARDLGRLHEIASVLIRWGFGDTVRRLGMSHALERAGRALHFKESVTLSDIEPPERVVKALEELGPTFIKLGQLLSTRVDLFSDEWITAFETLQDQVKPLPIEELQEEIEAVFGADPNLVLERLDSEAFAAASIAQVHRARLKTGEEVVVKFRRPQIEKQVEGDLRLLNRLAEIAEHNITELKRFQPVEIVKQFAQSLRRELNLEEEGRNAERIAKSFVDDPNVVIPRIYWDWTCEQVNVQEFIRGTHGRKLLLQTDGAFDRRELARRGGKAILKMVLVDGFFHADPHLGNLIALPGNRVAFIDFGMVGRLTSLRKDQVTDLLFALVKKNPPAVVQVLRMWVEERRPIADEVALLNEVD